MKLRVLLMLSLAAGLAGCSSGRRSVSVDPMPQVERAEHVDTRTVGATRPAPRVLGPEVEDYQLAPRDQVVFQMFNEPDIATTQRLSSRGELTLPLIGSVNLAGKTLREAEKEIRGRYLEGGFFIDPHVMISVSEYGAHFVQVLGQVNRPDRIELPIEAASIGLIAAITQAGGFTRLAKENAVQITRLTPDGGERHFTVDVREMLRRGQGEEFQLRPGDVVFVPERLI